MPRYDLHFLQIIALKLRHAFHSLLSPETLNLILATAITIDLLVPKDHCWAQLGNVINTLLQIQ